MIFLKSINRRAPKLLAFLSSLTLAIALPAAQATEKGQNQSPTSHICDRKQITYMPLSLKDALTWGRVTHCVIPALLPPDENWAIVEQRDANFQKGNQYLFAGDWDSAAEEYTTALIHNPKNTSALANRSTAYYMRMFFQNRDPLKFVDHLSAKITPHITIIERYMLDDLKNALKAHPECAVLHRNLALQNAFRVSMFAAGEEAEKAAKLNPDSVLCLYTAAVYHNMVGQSEPALHFANSAIERSPHSPVLLIERALIYFSRAKYKEALADVSEAIKEEPRNAFAYRLRAICRMVEHKFKAALPDLVESVRLWPNYGDAYQTLAVDNNELGNYEQAIHCARKALQCGGNQFECNYIIGLALLNQKHYKEALESLDEALRLDPASCKAHIEKAAACAGLKEYKQALASVNRAIELNPNNSRALSLRAQLSAHTGSFEQSISDIFESKKLSQHTKPQTTQTNGNFSYELVAKDTERARLESAPQFKRGALPESAELKKAIDGYSRLIALKHAGAAPYFSRGVLYICMGERKQAIDDLIEARHLSDAGRTEVLSALLIVELLKDSNEKEKAQRYLADHKSSCPDAYFAKLVEFERGDCQSSDLLKFTSPASSGWAHYFVARRLLAAGKRAEAENSLKWIRDNSELESEEYSLALALLAALESHH